MNYNVLKESIIAVIKANGNEEITGDLLQQVLLAMVNVLGSGYQFEGIAVPSTNPGTPDARVFYVATQAGTYNNFGSPAIVLDGSQIAILLFASSWTPVVLSVPTKEYVDTALALKVDKVEGKGLSTNDLTNELVALINGAFQKANIEQELGDSTTKVVSQAAITAVLLQYAKVDGYYSQLTAGAAENLVGRGSVPASFLRRTTGGTADVGTGSAKIAKLMGNSIVWNQQLAIPATDQSKSESDVVVTDNRDGSYHFDGTPSANISLTLPSISIISGHKYYISPKSNGKLELDCSGYSNFDRVPSTKTAMIVTCTVSNYTIPYLFALASDGAVDAVGSPIIIDLTLMFGAGKEPTTAAEFEALFPLPYYVKEAGKVLPFAAGKLVTTGFNQWDEERENGAIRFSDGAKVDSITVQRTKNPIRVFPQTDYYFSALFAINSGTYGIAWYDANDNFISGQTLTAAGVIKSPAGAYYLRASMILSDENGCINLSWSGYRNGEYEPYELHEAIFDPANWEDADGNKIFPYGGMHGVGTARDFATPDADGFIRKATRIWDRRAYAAGDENDPAVITDGSTYTFVQLAEPVETELAEPVGASYYANDFGTEEWQPANTDVPYTAPCDMNVAYAMNAVDTLRRLPENYISVGSFENFCTELATKLGAALNKTITIAATYNSETEEYDYAITIADIEG